MFNFRGKLNLRITIEIVPVKRMHGAVTLGGRDGDLHLHFLYLFRLYSHSENSSDMSTSSGVREGFHGISIEWNATTLKKREPFQVNGGSPAEAAGLKAGDAVIRVNNTDMFNLRHKDAQDVIVRAGNSFEVTVQR